MALTRVIEPKWYTTTEVAVMLGYGLTKVKHLIAAGQLESLKDGGSRRILPEHVEAYVRRKAREQAA